MSVRVHAIAKEVNKSSKELIEILTERGYDIKSASASIDNITAQSIIEEFTADQPEPGTEEASTPVAEKVESVVPAEPAKKAPIVKSKADLDKEKHEKEEAEKAEKAKLVQDKPLSPSSSKVPTVPPPPSTRASAPPPPPSTAGKSGIPSPPPGAAKASTSQVAAPSADGDDNVVVEGNLILIKPPIVVRDFATFIGLKPFQLISELMEMGIFASMNQTIDEEVARKIAKVKGFELEIKHRGEKAETSETKKKVVIDENDEKFLKPRPQ